MDAEPKIWILSRGRKGDLDQMLALARATGWPHEVKSLRFAWIWRARPGRRKRWMHI
jgi:hypothetical protein